MKPNFLFITLFLLFSIALSAQPGEKMSTNAELYKEIASLDSIVFNAFNARDVERFKVYFSEDLEFFHDKGGLTGHAHTINFLESLVKSNNDLRRELVKETMEIYPIPGYGAMQIGAHKFCHMENNKEECGVFRFVHIWQKKNNEWKITRVVSYGH